MIQVFDGDGEPALLTYVVECEFSGESFGKLELWWTDCPDPVERNVNFNHLLPTIGHSIKLIVRIRNNDSPHDIKVVAIDKAERFEIGETRYGLVLMMIKPWYLELVGRNPP